MLNQRKSIKHFAAIGVLILSLAFLVACNLGITLQPEYLPVEFQIDPFTGEIKVSAEPSIVTPIGRIGIQYTVPDEGDYIVIFRDKKKKPNEMDSAYKISNYSWRELHVETDGVVPIDIDHTKTIIDITNAKVKGEITIGVVRNDILDWGKLPFKYKPFQFSASMLKTAQDIFSTRFVLRIIPGFLASIVCAVLAVILFFVEIIVFIFCGLGVWIFPKEYQSIYYIILMLLFISGSILSFAKAR